MIFLYPNSTFLLQPADVAVFRSLKSLWREENRLTKQNEIAITKLNFADIFLKAFVKIAPQVIKTGFFKCGLFPFNSENVDYSKCLGKDTSLVSSPLQVLEHTFADVQSESHTLLAIALQQPFIFLDQSVSIEELNLTSEQTHELFIDDVEESHENTLQETEVFEGIEEPMSVEEPILKLPPTPKRMGKRNLKRTHPVAERNIDTMLESRVLKAQIEDSKQARKMARIEKKKITIATKLEKAKKRKEKDEKTIALLTQQQTS
jgi:hypothetical protein